MSRRRSQPPFHTPSRAVAVGASATVLCTLPVYLTGALAVQLIRDLAFGATQLGLAVGVFRGTSAIASSPIGIVADRIGATLSLRIAVSTVAVSSIGVAASATNWTTLVLWLIIGACGKTLCQPAANRLIMSSVQSEHQGLAFGLKQSAVPASSAISGLSVPLIALTVGWRWAYAMVAIMAVVVLFMIGRRNPGAPEFRSRSVIRSRLPERGTILILAISFGFGTAASTTIPTFYVDAAVRGGSSPQFAGSLLAVASIAAITTRVAAGALCDRMKAGHLRLCGALLIIGSVGFALMALETSMSMALGVIVALFGTWGFNGVFWYSMLRAYPEVPGRITGVVAPGALLGGVAGPIVVGVLADRASYPLGWMLACVAALLAASGMIYSGPRLAALTSAMRPRPVG